MIGGNSEDSERIVSWSGVFREEVEAFRSVLGSLNGLLIVDVLERGGEVLNF